MITGAVLSMLTFTVSEPTLPAMSVAEANTLWSMTSDPTVTGGSHSATPDSESTQENTTSTSVLFQPLALGSGVRAPSITGGVRSRLIVTLVVEALPAISSATPVTIWFAPSATTVTGSVQLARPDSVSAHINSTVGETLCQPLAWGGGTTFASMVGGKSSSQAKISVSALFGLLRTSTSI